MFLYNKYHFYLFYYLTAQIVIFTLFNASYLQLVSNVLYIYGKYCMGFIIQIGTWIWVNVCNGSKSAFDQMAVFHPLDQKQRFWNSGLNRCFRDRTLFLNRCIFSFKNTHTQISDFTRETTFYKFEALKNFGVVTIQRIFNFLLKIQSSGFDQNTADEHEIEQNTNSVFVFFQRIDQNTADEREIERTLN